MASLTPATQLTHTPTAPDVHKDMSIDRETPSALQCQKFRMPKHRVSSCMIMAEADTREELVQLELPFEEVISSGIHHHR
jgi:hypothetical protein